jgi:shikimate kinase
VLVCGPPGAGKTTWSRRSGLTVYDRDDPEWQSEREFRDAIARLADDPDAQAAVIRTGATRSARARSADLIGATETIVLAVDADECRRRITARGPQAMVSVKTQMAAVDTWWRRYEPSHEATHAGDPTTTPPAPTGWTGGSTYAWRKTRARILERDGHACQLKLPEVCTWTADQVHHVLGRGVSEADEDLVSACQPCNLRLGKPDTDPPHKATTW